MFQKRFTEKETLKIRNDIFLQDVVPILEEKGFSKPPFKSASFGRTSSSNIFIYEMCRLRATNSILEFVTTKICRHDKYIKIYINAFKLCPPIQSMQSLLDVDGTKFSTLPCSGNEMWIDVDFIVGPPLFSKDFWFNCLKLKNTYTTKGCAKRIKALRVAATTKVSNIDTFFSKWYAKHCPYTTNWNGDLLNNPSKDL